MAEPLNPYNSSKPGNLFTGYERERRQLRRGLRNGKSYALLGGRRCGKTSLLLELAKDLEAEGLEGFQVVPRFFDVQGEIPRSTGDFCRSLATLVAADLSVEPFRATGSTQPYQEFLGYLDAVRLLLKERHGSSWLAVLLIDELDVAAPFLPDAECFHNLRNLLMTSRYARHFRVVASGVASLADLVQSGSPLNNLEQLFLRRLDKDEARELVAAGFEASLSPTLETTLLEQTGRHPYLLQGLLENLWEEREVLDEAAVPSAIRRFVRNHEAVFERWLAGIGRPGRAIYHHLAQAGGESTSTAELRRLVQPGETVGQALNGLAYHGLIDDSGDGPLRIAGSLFRDWFRDNYDPGMEGTGDGGEIPDPSVVEPTPEVRRSGRDKNVFVVHGRNRKIYNNMLRFLRALGLEPLEWTELVLATGKGAPYIGEILEQGFSMARAAVVLLTPDDEGRLRPEFHQENDPRTETEPTPQPRPNVIFEAGMAMAKFPDNTILVRFGRVRDFSDISGIHLLDMDGSIKAREHLARRLEKCGCAVVDLDADPDWQTAGDFSQEGS